MVSLLMHIYVTRPYWVKHSFSQFRTYRIYWCLEAQSINDLNREIICYGKIARNGITTTWNFDRILIASKQPLVNWPLVPLVLCVSSSSAAIIVILLEDCCLSCKSFSYTCTVSVLNNDVNANASICSYVHMSIRKMSTGYLLIYQIYDI